MISLRLFSAESTADALYDHLHFVFRNAKYFGNNRLGFSRVLARGMHEYFPALSGDSQGRLRFEIPVLLGTGA